MWRDWLRRIRRWAKALTWSFVGLAQNGVRRETVPYWLSGTRRTLWSFEKTNPFSEKSSAGSYGMPLCLWSSSRAAARLRARS
jgi:hypothetical protein